MIEGALSFFLTYGIYILLLLLIIGVTAWRGQSIQREGLLVGRENTEAIRENTAALRAMLEQDRESNQSV